MASVPEIRSLLPLNVEFQAMLQEPLPPSKPSLTLPGPVSFSVVLFPWGHVPTFVTAFICHSSAVGLPVPLNGDQQAPSAGTQLAVFAVWSFPVHHAIFKMFKLLDCLFCSFWITCFGVPTYCSLGTP